MGLAYLAIRLIVGVLPEYSLPHEVVISLNIPVLWDGGTGNAQKVLRGICPVLTD